MLVLYDYDSNGIPVEPMKSKSVPEILAAYKRAHALLTQRGLKPQKLKLDNEASAALQKFTTSVDVAHQLFPPHIHRRNTAERAIDTLAWSPTQIAMPTASSTDLAIAAARDLIDTF
jgi:hypothetical protein